MNKMSKFDGKVVHRWLNCPSSHCNARFFVYPIVVGSSEKLKCPKCGYNFVYSYHIDRKDQDCFYFNARQREILLFDTRKLSKNDLKKLDEDWKRAGYE